MLIVANWKAYVSDLRSARALVASAKRLAARHRAAIVLAPSAPHLGLLARGNRSKVKFAAQDVSAEESGAHTGETVAESARDAGAAYAIVGHSERRARGDTDEAVAKKARQALANGLIPILCIGERERDGGEYLAFIRTQISAVMASVSQKDRARIVIAYEPVWAIGKSARDAIRPGDLAEMTLYIRKVLGDFLPGNGPAKAKVLYGGSVEPENAATLKEAGRIDGFLVGHASVETRSFSELVSAVS